MANVAGRQGESAGENLEDIHVEIDLSDIKGEAAKPVARASFEVVSGVRLRNGGAESMTVTGKVTTRSDRCPWINFYTLIVDNLMTVIQQAVSFKRFPGEHLEDYLKRTDKLYRKITTREIEQVLANRLNSICDGDKT